MCLGQRHPYLPGRAQDSRGAAAAGAMAGRRAQSGLGVFPRSGSPPAPRNPRLAVLSPLLRLQLLSVRSGSGLGWAGLMEPGLTQAGRLAECWLVLGA